MRKIWSDEAWEDYLYWQNQDKKTLRRINKLISDIEETIQPPHSSVAAALQRSLK